MKTEYKITTTGTPSIGNLSNTEKKLFYSTLLEAITEHYKKESPQIKNTPSPAKGNNDDS